MNTVLFDLDGTLLNINTDEFMKAYMKKLYPRLKDTFTSEEFNKYMNESIMAAILSEDESKTNEEVFIEVFASISGKDINKVYKHITEFYSAEYTTIEGMYSKSKYMIKSVDVLKRKGYNLVVATNPLFPHIALAKRVEWAGLNPKDFKFITSIEKMKFCKPSPKYYSQILEIICKEASECLMVGNDVQEDLVASTIGIRTYLVTNNILNRTREQPSAHRISDAKGFYKFVKALPIINKI
ncbi:HAD family hydrolase [Clostridium cylindrosporum]|uniref:Haloacid dehalogenase domain protein hydrolase n=1 Tax=Clostridium cylindrosporum DSM 605 TaxID=1121307 RepID=A0A0J8G1N8_CLOCY|nr:HAD family hydrolase [Clostridium cylindrosporum]KMT21666.1 haloacid dehalogenase domain protein hydrolase [Clostridium cylindrosporum DSM 605]